MSRKRVSFGCSCYSWKKTKTLKHVFLKNRPKRLWILYCCCCCCVCECNLKAMTLCQMLVLITHDSSCISITYCIFWHLQCVIFVILYCVARFGHGAFLVCFEALYKVSITAIITMWLHGLIPHDLFAFGLLLNLIFVIMSKSRQH